MLTPPGYPILHKLHSSPRALLFCAEREGQRYALKLAAGTPPPAESLQRLRHEYEMLAALGGNGAARAEALENACLILEYYPYPTLETLAADGGIPIPEFFAVAASLTASLAHVHAQGIFHLGLHPSHILYDTASERSLLLSFSMAQRSGEVSPVLTTRQECHLMPYASPEQTGRMNRMPDQRADLYTLGLILYRLLAGQLPWQPVDAVECAHYHLACPPPPPQRWRPEIPLMAAEIVLKLLVKDPAQRYQSAVGLLADWETCRLQWQANGAVESFALGRGDRPSKLIPPGHLYGRASQLSELQAAYQRASRGAAELLLVAGYAGIGKTALIRAFATTLHDTLGDAHAWFCAGKFEQNTQNMPYSALLDALNGLFRQWLVAPERELRERRAELLERLGKSAAVLVEVLPALALLLERQASPPRLPPAETRNRLEFALRDLIQALAQPAHPLVLFVDDLQWAEPASLWLLPELLSGRNLLLIGAYRSNEVPGSHPLNALCLRLRQANTPLSRLEMPPLTLLQINQLLADSLNCDSAATQDLAAAVLQKTEGNPLFIWEFLQSLQADQLLRYEAPRPGQHSGTWQWQLAAIEAHNISAGMAVLMAQKFQRLRGSTRELVDLAVCIGMQFELFLLAEAYAKTMRDTLAALWEAIDAGLIVPVDTAEPVDAASLQDSRANLRFTYRFAHDHIHQTLLDLVGEEKRQRMYCCLGKRLLDQSAGQERSNQTLFNIVSYFGRCGAVHAQAIGWEELARLNLQAAGKAKAAASYEPALAWLRAGLALLPEDAWQQHYDLALALHSECAEIAYLCRDFAAAEQQVEIVLRQAHSVLDQVVAYETAILAAIARNQLATAVELGLQALARLGEPFPQRPTTLRLLLDYGRARLALLGKRPGELRQSAVMSEPLKLAAMRILSLTGAAAYLTAPELLAMFTFRQVRLSVRYGNSDLSAHAYAAYALILCGVLGEIETGNRFGALALELAEQSDSREHHARVLHMVYTCVYPWKKPYAELISGLLTANASALENGDLEFAMYALHVHAFYRYCMGAALPETAALTAGYSTQMTRFQQEVARNLNNILLQMQYNWMGDSDDPLILKGRAYDRVAMLPRHQAENQRGALFSLYFYEAMLSYCWEQYEPALTRLQQAAPYLDGMTGSPLLAYFHFYNGLCRLALPDSRAHRKAIQTARRRLKTCAGHAPANFLHLHLLLEAEAEAVSGKAAMPLYQQAMERARQTGYIHEEALACELAGRFYLRQNQAVAAQMAIQEAWNAYARWGARAKLRQLERRYPWLLAGQSATAGTVMPPLDLQSVLKASQAIAGEIVLERLLEKLLKIALENAGARRGALLFKDNAGWALRAAGTLEQVRILPDPGIPLEQANGEAPLSVVYYVARAAAPLVLAEAGQQEPFSHDPYIKANGARSLLCLPLLKQGGFDAILLLENNLSGGVFTPARMEVLKLLSGQMATALENARLYAELRGLNLSLNQEIRERRQAEAALRESETRLQQVIETLPLAIIVSRRDDGRIFYANLHAVLLLGISVEELLSLRAVELYANPADRQKLLARLLQNNHRIEGEEVLLKPRGRRIWVEAFIQPFVFNGENALLTALHDITARKEKSDGTDAALSKKSGV